MKALPRYPALVQLNTRVRMSQLARELGRPATLDDMPDSEIDWLARGGFDVVYLLGVWQTGPAARAISASDPDAMTEYRRILPDFTDADVVGSPFAVRDYHVHTDFGGDEALARLRERLAARDMRLMVDFVPNHVAPDHPWVDQHPDFFIEGTDQQLAAQPLNWRRLQTATGERVLAYGRDPHFAGWSDTLQLNYGNSELQDAMAGELTRIATQCDGVRCDMAMLVLPDVFSRTWAVDSRPFWPRVTSAVHEAQPGFVFMAEVYWDLEWRLQQDGFDYTYDKRLYDRLREGRARPVREHLWAGLDFQDHLARFLENHDEPRAAATFSPAENRAAAVVTFFAPGLRFIHQGQRAGRKVRIPMHLGRGPDETPDAQLSVFYDRLLACLDQPISRDGDWQLLDARPAWDGNATNDDFVCYGWTGPSGERRVVAVNYSAHQSQCRVDWPWPEPEGSTVELADAMCDERYLRSGGDLNGEGLFVDLPAWGYNVFEVASAG